jgi:UDP-N-acetylglucosamine 4-epimerase
VIPKFVDAVLSGEAPVIHGDGKQSRDFSFIDNVVNANLLAANATDAPGHIMNLGNGGRTTLIELYDAICKTLGRRIEPIFGPPRAGDVRDSQADISLAKRLIGYAPTVGLEEGLRITVDWFQKDWSAK